MPSVFGICIGFCIVNCAKIMLKMPMLDFPDNEVTIISGGFGAVYCIFQALLNPGDEVIVPDLSFPPYWGDIALAEGVAVPIPLRENRDFRIDPEECKEKISKRTKAILLKAPENPTGVSFR